MKDAATMVMVIPLVKRIIGTYMIALRETKLERGFGSTKKLGKGGCGNTKKVLTALSALEYSEVIPTSLEALMRLRHTQVIIKIHQ